MSAMFTMRHTALRELYLFRPDSYGITSIKNGSELNKVQPRGSIGHSNLQDV